MAQMIVRNLPDEVLGAFKELARVQGLSQEEAARRLIEREVESHDRRANFLRRVEAIQERWRREGRTFSDSTEIIRRMRGEI